jgi:hypothetical protein
MRPIIISLLLITIISASSCNEKEDFVTDKLQDYFILAPGKYITYRLDSMVFTNFGRTTEIHRYQVRDVVDQQVTDNLGRPAYRIFRYIRDSAGTQSWQPAGLTYTVTLLADQAEISENNLRFIKLHLPVGNGFTWKGNKYLPTSTCAGANGPYCEFYNFSNDDNMIDWDFLYDGPLATFSYNGSNYTDVLTVEQADESFNVPITVPTAYGARSRSVEKYSKTIGLVYRQYELWEYQPNTGGAGGPYKTGFGITMWMIDHN